ncbi:MAG TPA: hypothetical protein DCS93_37760 [Microscillaceae bacterium]|nr:hypothetical protein [Microscillaceae bacterium]
MFSEDKLNSLVHMFSSLPAHLCPVLRHEEYILRLAQQIMHFAQSGMDKRPPFYEEECTPTLHNIIKPFLQAFDIWKTNTKNGKRDFYSLLEKTSIEKILLVMGQRQTSASVSDVGGLPPLRDHLLASFGAYHKHSLSVGARAWCKHANRSEDNFWGKVKGNDDYKNRMAELILQKLLTQYTWWNVFKHYKHGVVYEVRVPSGHGARWSTNGTIFIGFLEPFIET